MIKDTDAKRVGYREARAREIQRCADDRLYLAAVYGTIYEARPDESGETDAGYIPFIPYPFQVEVWDWLDDLMSKKGRRGDGLIKKSRTMGLSNITVFWAATKWMIETPFQARLASRVADLVDNAGDTDSLFWKLDTFLQGLPEWLFLAFCPGFKWSRSSGCRNAMIIRNPRNGNTIKGESTTANLGRGGRATIIIYDEAAFMDNFGTVWTAGRASTRHRLAVSTVNISNGMEFHDLEKGKNGYTAPNVLEVPWNTHPDHDDKWLKDEMERDTVEGVKREILMDYFAGTGEWVYPEAQSKECGNYPYEPYAGPVFGAFDDGFDDEWAIHLIQYNVMTGRHRVFESYRNRHQKTDFYGALMTGTPRSDLLWTEKEERFAALIRRLPGITWVGDPHISNREQITGMSVFEHLQRNWNVHVMYDMSRRGHPERKNALSHILRMMDFHDTIDVQYTLNALQRNRYKRSRQGAELQTEAKEPIHDDTSHPVQALQWYAMNFEVFQHINHRNINWTGEDNA